MTDNAAQLIADFKALKWKAPNLYERLFAITKDETAAFAYAQEFLNTFRETATIFYDSLSYINKEQFAKLVEQALQLLQAGKNEAAESVIEYASLQFPELLHPHLELIFELAPNQEAYYADYPWRNLPPVQIQPFKNRFIHPDTSTEDRTKLFSCLLETRDADTVAFAYQFARQHHFFDVENLDSYLLAYIEAVGFTKQGEEIRSYCPSPVRHLIFKSDYFPEASAIQISKTQHPSWRLPTDTPTYAFGGALDANTENPFFHIITFNPIPGELPVTGLTELCLGAHINEMNEAGTVFYQHDTAGRPVRLLLGEQHTVQYFRDEPIQPTRVSLATTPARWSFQSWGCSNGRENLFRVGGEPCWIQGPEVPVCPVCQEKMTFLMQLDSELPYGEGGELLFGSGGICYIFWCDQSKVSACLVQCT